MHSIEHFYYSDFALSLSAKKKPFARNCLRPRKKETSLQAPVSGQKPSQLQVREADALWNKLKTNKTWVTPTLEEIYAAGHPAAVPLDKKSLTFIPEPF